MNDVKEPALKKGMWVEITQQIPMREETWTSTTKGEVINFQQKQTGVHFAHSKGNHLWLDRLTLKLEDGEIIELSLDEYSHLQIVDKKED